VIFAGNIHAVSRDKRSRSCSAACTDPTPHLPKPSCADSYYIGRGKKPRFAPTLNAQPLASHPAPSRTSSADAVRMVYRSVGCQMARAVEALRLPNLRAATSAVTSASFDAAARPMRRCPPLAWPLTDEPPPPLPTRRSTRRAASLSRSTHGHSGARIDAVPGARDARTVP